MDIRHAVGVKVGIAPAKLAALDDYRDSALFTAREVAALDFAERVVREDLDVSEECWSRLGPHFSDPEIVELALIVGYQMLASAFGKAFALAPQGLAPQAAAS